MKLVLTMHFKDEEKEVVLPKGLSTLSHIKSTPVSRLGDGSMTQYPLEWKWFKDSDKLHITFGQEIDKLHSAHLPIIQNYTVDKRKIKDIGTSIQLDVTKLDGFWYYQEPAWVCKLKESNTSKKFSKTQYSKNEIETVSIWFLFQRSPIGDRDTFNYTKTCYEYLMVYYLNGQILWQLVTAKDTQDGYSYSLKEQNHPILLVSELSEKAENFLIKLSQEANDTLPDYEQSNIVFQLLFEQRNCNINELVGQPNLENSKEIDM